MNDHAHQIKQIGECPFCHESVKANIVEGNTARRDKCQCPKCDEFVYVCRTPGCHDYAKGTSFYDHELCPDCTKTLSSAASEIGKTGLKIAGTAGAALLVAAFKKGK
jgi:hypothetical protein